MPDTVQSLLHILADLMLETTLGRIMSLDPLVPSSLQRPNYYLHFTGKEQ